jgi:hypothetical protein
MFEVVLAVGDISAVGERFAWSADVDAGLVADAKTVVEFSVGDSSVAFAGRVTNREDRSARDSVNDSSLLIACL